MNTTIGQLIEMLSTYDPNLSITVWDPAPNVDDVTYDVGVELVTYPGQAPTVFIGSVLSS